MGGRDLMIFVLDQMQMLDQQIAAARPVAEQEFNFMKRLESNNCAAARCSPGETSSLPVENTATRMRLTASSCVRPKAAASATSCGRKRWPAFRAA